MSTATESNDLTELTAPIQTELEHFKRLESRVLKHESPLIFAISRHLLSTKGKRLRPTFAFLVSKTTGLEPKHLVEAALAVEMIHTATLLHDDVVDESDTRRGELTVNSKWNNLTSVLMGDYFFAKAFTLLVKTGSIELLGRVSKATERVSVGELRQIEETHNYDLSEEQYMRIISDKTAALFSTSAVSPSLLGKAPREVVSRLENFGEYSGCAFQIADDLLDLVGDSKRTGKKIGIDLEGGKVTLPLIYALKKSQTATRQSILKTLDDGIEHGGFEKVLDFVHSSGGIDYARARAASLADRALSYMEPFQSNEHFKTLEKLANFSINRDL